MARDARAGSAMDVGELACSELAEVVATLEESGVVDEKIEHTGLGDLLNSCAGPKVGEMRACQSV
uniref:Uncharacterized protein n=1 Tax=Oryza sativa subsp. japonica TaxID=39947 RepID=Q7Y146_ORYSJ|nr:hypothetical protein [Oryza sativa Japonica Group]